MPIDAERRPAERLVIDASSVVAILLDPDAAERTRIEGAELLAPSLLPYEVANVLRRLRNGGTLPSVHADQAFRDLSTLNIELWDWRVFAERAWQLGANASSYDAAYLALAEYADADLITRDARMARVAGSACRVAVFA